MAATDKIVDKATLVRIHVNAAWHELGYTRNQVVFHEEPFYGPIHSDLHGGDEGPPVDIQIFGKIFRGELELVQYDADKAKEVRKLINNGNPDQFADSEVGKLLFADNEAPQVNFKSTNRPLRFPRCKIEDITETKGNKHSTFSFSFEAHRDDSGVLFFENNS